jgi:hypothetical protein
VGPDGQSGKDGIHDRRRVPRAPRQWHAISTGARLLYWQLDTGGPSGRLVHSEPYPDFQFPQTGAEGLAPPGWQPRFQDHLYLAYTNVVAFSPTDTLPLTHRVKGLMATQSMISLAVLVVVISRVINILPS